MVDTQPQPASALPNAPLRMTYDEFLNNYDGEYAEWVDGEVIPLMPPDTQHALIVAFLTTALNLFAQRRGIGTIITAPYQMKLGNGREPDLLFLANASLDRLTNKILAGPADLAIEVISPDSVTRDRQDKYKEYEAGGVREYWILDPKRKHTDFYQRWEGRFRSVPVGADGVYHSLVMPGVWVRPEWFWTDPLPPVWDVLSAWGIV